ncbi:flagellar motor switch protein [Enterococcus durans]|uniref:Flagellar motor switch protein n=1 Tax=Enterococcus durans TaxID=53345 RepID=A0A377KL97_9ENTE|nr:hypothetical protein [Enterococcus durans]STP29733.1 flagellar motor switch protein [Enterococcus durans]
METEEQRKDRIAKKKLEMQRLCRMLDIEDWDQNEWLLREVRSIVQKEKKAKKETEKSTGNKVRSVATSKSIMKKHLNSLYIANSVSK